MTEVELDLHYVKKNSYTKFQFDILNHKKSLENWSIIDRQTDKQANGEQTKIPLVSW